jgi:hypothetical protein
MKVDFSQTLKNHKGQPLKDGAEDATLATIAYTALSTLVAAEQNLARDERLRRGRLLQKIVAAEGAIDLKAEEVALIKQCIGGLYGPWVVVQTEDMLEPPGSESVRVVRGPG